VFNHLVVGELSSVVYRERLSFVLRKAFPRECQCISNSLCMFTFTQFVYFEISALSFHESENSSCSSFSDDRISFPVSNPCSLIYFMRTFFNHFPLLYLVLIRIATLFLLSVTVFFSSPSQVFFDQVRMMSIYPRVYGIFGKGLHPSFPFLFSHPRFCNLFGGPSFSYLL